MSTASPSVRMISGSPLWRVRTCRRGLICQFWNFSDLRDRTFELTE